RRGEVSHFSHNHWSNNSDVSLSGTPSNQADILQILLPKQSCHCSVLRTTISVSLLSRRPCSLPSLIIINLNYPFLPLTPPVQFVKPTSWEHVSFFPFLLERNQHHL